MFTISTRYRLMTTHPENEEVTIYEIRPRVDGKGCNLISEALQFGRLWFAGSNAITNAIKFAKFNSRSHDALIRVYDDAGNVIDRHAHVGEFKEWSTIHTSDFAQNNH